MERSGRFFTIKPAVLVVLLLSAALAGCGSSSKKDDEIALALALELVAEGLAFPTAMAVPPGDTERLFVAEKGGRILIVRDGAVVAEPFLDLGGEVFDDDETGLLGLAFDPDYEDNGRFFVSYVDFADTTQIVRYQVSDDPDVADPASAVTIFTVPQPDPYHNGGMIAFGPDGMFYLALGDGNWGDGSGDPAGHAQNKATPFGGLLRIDVSGDGYEIPADNPFVGEVGALGELWAIGFRNPWRFAFDADNGDLYIADVGHEAPTAREEINVVPGPDAGKGLNFGWNRFEGSQCFNAALGCDDTGLTPPLVEYAHPAGPGGFCAASVTGGYVYRGAAIPELAGTYFYSDFCVSWVRSFRYENGAAVDEFEWDELRPPGGNVVAFGEDAAGELYLLTMQGQVYRIVADD
jgi:glucose/arabinose dehydrogenase